MQMAFWMLVCALCPHSHAFLIVNAFSLLCEHSEDVFPILFLAQCWSVECFCHPNGSTFCDQGQNRRFGEWSQIQFSTVWTVDMFSVNITLLHGIPPSVMPLTFINVSFTFLFHSFLSAFYVALGLISAWKRVLLTCKSIQKHVSSKGFHPHGFLWRKVWSGGFRVCEFSSWFN